MAQIDFCMNNEDIRFFLEYLFSKGGFVIVDKNYESPSYLIVNNIDKVVALINDGFLFFIGHPTFFKEEIPMNKQSTKGFYYLRQRYGGEVINLMYTAELKEGSKSMLGYSNLSYYSSSYSKDGTHLISASKELKAFYKDLTKFIKNNSKMQFPHFKRKIWLANSAYRNVVSGTLLQDVKPEILELIYEN